MRFVLPRLLKRPGFVTVAVKGKKSYGLDIHRNGFVAAPKLELRVDL